MSTVVAISKSVEFSYLTGRHQELHCQLLPIGTDLKAYWLLRCNGHERSFTTEEFIESGRAWVARALKVPA